MKRIKHTALALGLTALMLSGHALAVPVTVAGTTVSFTFDSALGGLFGTPTVVGDALYFTPTSFKAQSFNGAGFAAASQSFNVTINAHSGFQLTAVNLTESGDYYNIGVGSGVAVGGGLYVRDLDAPLTSAASAKLKVSQPLSVLTSLADFQATDWTAQAGMAIPAGWGGADGIVSGINVSLENLLLANSLSAGSAAFIEKKFAGLAIDTSLLLIPSPVPEPQAYALFLAGLGLVGYAARRKIRAAA